MFQKLTSFRYRRSGVKKILLGVVIVCSLLFHGIVTAPPVNAPVPDPVPTPDIVTVPHIPAPVSTPAPKQSEGIATAYCNCKDTMNGETGVTAAGYDLDKGLTYKGYRILASDKKYPFGTLVDIHFENGDTIHGIVLDRGGKIFGNHFDIALTSRAKSFEFGTQKITFEIKGAINI